jgi:hypothetical protein
LYLGGDAYRSLDAAHDARLELFGTSGRGLDPDMLSDLIKVGGDKIQHGIADFAEWSKAMVGDFGEWVKPHLDSVYRALRRHFGEEVFTDDPEERPREDPR